MTRIIVDIKFQFLVQQISGVSISVSVSDSVRKERIPLKGPAVLREINEKRILNFLRTTKTSSRQEMTEALQLSKNTVSLIIEKFIRDGVVQEVGIDSNGVGRPRTQLSLVPDAYQAIGILVRDTHCEFTVTDYNGSIIESNQLLVNTREPAKLLVEIDRLYRDLKSLYGNILGVGIAVPGLVDPLRGLVHYSSHLGWRNVAVAEILGKTIDVPIQVLNLVKAAALSPVRVVPDDAQSTFYIRIDEGVGGAFVLGNDVVHGFSYTAGEIGHLVVTSEGPICTCGQRGCLEALISLPRVLSVLREKGLQASLMDDFSTVIQDLLNNRQTSSDIQEVMTGIGKYLGVAMAMTTNLFNPEYIVVDSPYNNFAAFEQAAISTMRERALIYPSDRTKVVFVRMLSAALGMALAVIHQFESTIGSSV